MPPTDRQRRQSPCASPTQMQSPSSARYRYRYRFTLGWVVWLPPACLAGWLTRSFYGSRAVQLTHFAWHLSSAFIPSWGVGGGARSICRPVCVRPQNVTVPEQALSGCPQSRPSRWRSPPARRPTTYKGQSQEQLYNWADCSVFRHLLIWLYTTIYAPTNPYIPLVLVKEIAAWDTTRSLIMPGTHWKRAKQGICLPTKYI